MYRRMNNDDESQVALYVIWFPCCMHMLVVLGTKDLGDISKHLLHAVRQSR